MLRATPCRAAGLVFGLLFGVQAGAFAQDAAQASVPVLDADAAVARSQAAIGRSLGDHSFLDADNQVVRLADYRGRPLVVALVFTACTESCPLIVQRLAEAVEVAQEALGPESFAVVTVGFDAAHDTPARMKAYARTQGVGGPGWRFLSGDRTSVDALIDDLGFSRVPSPGADFEVPALVEPLKVLALGQATVFTDVAAVIERVKLFCTFFDPKSGRYAVDYSFVISLTVGGLALLGLAVLLGRALWTMNHPPKGPA
jgi:protein SCO1/2